MLLAVFGRFSIIFDLFDPGILTFIFERSILLQREILEACFWASKTKLGPVQYMHGEWRPASGTHQTHTKSLGLSPSEPSRTRVRANIEI